MVFFTTLISLIASSELSAQVMVSNLNNFEGGSTELPVWSPQWRATQFTTGPNASGYELESVRAIFDDAVNTPSLYEARIYSDNSGQPGSVLEVLFGDSPVNGGIHLFASSALPLQPSTSYWFAHTSASPVESGSFFLPWFAGSTLESSPDGWLIGDVSLVDAGNQGGSWSSSGFGPAHMEVQALTVVPEPRDFAVWAGLGLLAFAAIRQRRKTKVEYRAIRSVHSITL